RADARLPDTQGLLAQRRDGRRARGLDRQRVLLQQPQLLERYPALELELITDRRLLDLARREAELAIRTLRATQGGLVSRRLGTMRLRLYGGHDYLERQGAPATEVELSRHTLLISGTRSQGAPEELLLERFAKKARVSLRTQGWSAQAEAAAAGLGIAALPCFIADSHPRLRR